MESNNKYQLQELGGSSYEIVDGQPNIKGWDVNIESGKIGKVSELLFDESSRKVRYIITNLDSDFTKAQSRKVLVPVGIAELHENDDVVLLPGVTSAQLLSLPEYEKDQLTADKENTIRNAFETAGGVGLASEGLSGGSVYIDDSFYDHQHFDETNLYKNRKTDNDSDQSIPVIKEELQVGKEEVQTGGIRLRSRMIETPVEKDITLREETVRVNRIPVDRPASDSDLREGSIEMNETTEVPVVSKEARIVEEVSLKKEVSEKEQTIRDTVKETQIDMEKNDGDSYRTKDTD